MKSSSRTILSRFALLATIAASPLFMTDAYAFGGKPGGPFSNGSYFPNDGTFSAVLRAADLIGTLQFSTSASSASTGTAVIYNEGDTYIGNSNGAFNAGAKSIAVTFQADSKGQGQQEATVKKEVTYPSGNGTFTTETTDFRKIGYFDSLYCNGYADCKTSNDFPTQKFSGTGSAVFQKIIYPGDSPEFDASEPKEFSVSGVRLSNSASQFSTKEITPPYVNEFSISVQAP